MTIVQMLNLVTIACALISVGFIFKALYHINRSTKALKKAADMVADLPIADKPKRYVWTAVGPERLASPLAPAGKPTDEQ